ncbi:hypothetical protein KCU83_g396, partial [Aureobasidium melanogenum]
MRGRHCLAYGEEVALDPLKDGSQTEKNRTSEEEDTDDTSKTASTSKAHQDHGEGEGRDDEASETHGYGIGEALDVVAMAGSLREEVMLRLWLCDFSKTASAEGRFTSVVEGSSALFIIASIFLVACWSLHLIKPEVQISLVGVWTVV